MAGKFEVAIVSPEREVLTTEGWHVSLPGSEGYLGVLMNHEPTVVALKAGIVEIGTTAGPKVTVAVAGGFAEITGSRVTILADSAENAVDIDLPRAQAALERAKRDLQSMEGDKVAAKAAEERAMARIAAKKNT